MQVKTVNLVAAVIVHDGHILATQRGYGEFKGWWEFPGGKIENGEAPEQALIREIKEELNTEITVNDYLDTVEYDYPTFHLSMRTFLCSMPSMHMSLLEHSDAKWLSQQNLDTVNWLPADLGLIEKLKSIKI